MLDIFSIKPIKNIMLEIPSNEKPDDKLLASCMHKIKKRFKQKVEFSYYLSDDLIDDCIDNKNCMPIRSKILQSINNQYFENISFDKKLNKWNDLNVYKSQINLNSWTYYSQDIDDKTLKHKRIIYKNKELNFNK